MPGVDFRAVRARVSMTEVLELLGFVGQESQAGQLRGRCPVHGSTTPSSRCFSVNPRKNAFHCFKCGASGNQLDLWAAVTQQSVHAAAVDLCIKLHRDVPWIERG
jgi:DNA primase